MIRHNEQRALGPALLVISIGMTTISYGLAQEAPPAGDRALSEALFRDGRALMDAGKFDEACPKLAESHKLDPKPGTILNLAVCQEQRGQVAQAWASYVEAARLSGRAKQKSRENAAKKKAAELEAILSKLTIEMQGELKEFSILIDGRAHSSAIVGTPVPLDPGDHEVEVRAPGYLPFRTRVHLPKGPVEMKVVVSGPFTPETTPSPAESAAPPAVSSAPPPPPVPSVSAPPTPPPPPVHLIELPPPPSSPAPPVHSAMRTGAYRGRRGHRGHCGGLYFWDSHLCEESRWR